MPEVRGEGEQDQLEGSLILDSTLIHLTSPPWRLRGKCPAACCPFAKFIPLTGATSPEGPEPCLSPGTCLSSSSSFSSVPLKTWGAEVRKARPPPQSESITVHVFRAVWEGGVRSKI